MAIHFSILDREIPQKSLVGYSPWGCKELDVTEHASVHITQLPTKSLHQAAASQAHQV